MNAKTVARFMERYAKGFGAGAFATPLPAEIEKLAAKGNLQTWEQGGELTAAIVSRRLDRRAVRKDFTGASYTLPLGAAVATHVAVDPDAQVPPLDRFDYVYAYREDPNLSSALEAAGFGVRAVRISASAEILGCWSRDGGSYPAYDAATLTEVPYQFPARVRGEVEAEVAALDGWHDDYPFYNRDGSWSALSLRGWKPDDPTWGLKPSEMSRAWWAENPEAAALRGCDWTVLSERCPTTVALLQSVEWWGQFERIRFLRLSGRGGKGGRLLRHTDITDRTAGTRDGQIVRFHLPIVTDPAVRTIAWDLEGRRRSAHLGAWRLYYLDQRKPHMVENPVDVERVHLVVDVVVDPVVRARIAESNEAA